MFIFQYYDYNVIIIDWQDGASGINYPKPASNARVAGACSGKFRCQMGSSHILGCLISLRADSKVRQHNQSSQIHGGKGRAGAVNHMMPGEVRTVGQECKKDITEMTLTGSSFFMGGTRKPQILKQDAIVLLEVGFYLKFVLARLKLDICSRSLAANCESLKGLCPWGPGSASEWSL